MTTTCTRKMTLDAGHRVPGHQGQCRNLHGHTYTVEVTVEGVVADDGMIVDFGILKTVMMDEVHARWDHAFLVWDHDDAARMALATDATWKVAVLPDPPTAENLAASAAALIAPRLGEAGVAVVRVVVWETPNCKATWEPDVPDPSEEVMPA